MAQYIMLLTGWGIFCMIAKYCATARTTIILQGIIYPLPHYAHHPTPLPHHVPHPTPLPHHAHHPTPLPHLAHHPTPLPNHVPHPAPLPHHVATRFLAETILY